MVGNTTCCKAFAYLENPKTKKQQHNIASLNYAVEVETDHSLIYHPCFLKSPIDPTTIKYPECHTVLHPK